MQYYLCPRCQFRVAVRKNVCPTCGFDMTLLKNAQSEDAKKKTNRANIFLRLLGGDKQKEAGTEKPALS